MKRFFAALLTLTCMLSLSACREEQAAAKPVIYLYPEEETAVTVKLDYAGALTCTYPAYGNGWAVTACPDGTLTDDAGQTYSYLYWEGTDTIAYDFSQGFCVAGTDTAAFLEDARASPGERPTSSSSTGCPRCRRIPIISSPSSRTAIRRRQS